MAKDYLSELVRIKSASRHAREVLDYIWTVRFIPTVFIEGIVMRVIYIEIKVHRTTISHL